MTKFGDQKNIYCVSFTLKYECILSGDERLRSSCVHSRRKLSS